MEGGVEGGREVESVPMKINSGKRKLLEVCKFEVEASANLPRAVTDIIQETWGLETSGTISGKSEALAGLERGWNGAGAGLERGAVGAGRKKAKVSATDGQTKT